jgi:protein-tyrosine phosphatase
MDWNAHLVMPNVYLGGQDAANDLTALRLRNISCVLDLSNGGVQVFPQIEYCIIPNIQDHPKQRIIHIFPECIRFIHNCLKHNRKVLVNCAAGISRSTTVLVSYMIYIHRMSTQDAIGHLRNFRKIVEPNPGFIRQLHSFEKSCKSFPAQRNLV